MAPSNVNPSIFRKTVIRTTFKLASENQGRPDLRIEGAAIDAAANQLTELFMRNFLTTLQMAPMRRATADSGLCASCISANARDANIAERYGSIAQALNDYHASKYRKFSGGIGGNAGYAKPATIKIFQGGADGVDAVLQYANTEAAYKGQSPPSGKGAIVGGAGGRSLDNIIIPSNIRIICAAARYNCVSSSFKSMLQDFAREVTYTAFLRAIKLMGDKRKTLSADLVKSQFEALVAER